MNASQSRVGINIRSRVAEIYDIGAASASLQLGEYLPSQHLYLLLAQQ